MQKYFTDEDVRGLWELILADRDPLQSDDITRLESSYKAMLTMTDKHIYVPPEGYDFCVCYNVVVGRAYISSLFEIKWSQILDIKYGVIGSSIWLYIPTLVLSIDFFDHIKKGSHPYKLEFDEWSSDVFKEGKGFAEDDLLFKDFLSELICPMSIKFESVRGGYRGVPLTHKNISYRDLPLKDWYFIREYEVVKLSD